MADIKYECNNFVNPLRKYQFDVAQDSINWKTVQSLEHGAFTKIAITLWENADIPSFTLAFLEDEFVYPNSEIIFKGHYLEWWPEVVKRVDSKVILLAFPKSFERILQEISKNVGNEILMFLESLQRAKSGLTFCKQLFLRYIQWTYGTIDYVKSISSLVTSSSLNTLEKIALSCYFCLEHSITEIEFNICDVNNIYFNKNPIIAYWINRDLSEKNEHGIFIFSLKETTDLLKWAIFIRNENAVQYIFECYHHYYKNSWRDFKKLIEYALKCGTTTTNIICYLISKINEEDNCEYIFIEYGNVIIQRIIKDLRLIYIFKWVAQYVLNHVTKMIFSDALNIIVLCWKERVVDRLQFRAILTGFIEKFKIHIIDCFRLSRKNACYKLFSIEMEKYLQSLCCAIPEGKRKRILLNKDVGFKKCIEWTNNFRSDLVDLILKEMKISDEDIEIYKNYLENAV